MRPYCTYKVRFRVGAQLELPESTRSSDSGFDDVLLSKYLILLRLLNSFYPVDNIINAFAQGAEALQLQVAYQTVQVLGGRRVVPWWIRVGVLELLEFNYFV